MPKSRKKALEDDLKAKQKEMLEIADIYLQALRSPEKLSEAPINQIASALGTLLDKAMRLNSDEPVKQEVTLADMLAAAWMRRTEERGKKDANETI